jgi:hypothetical protein
MTVQQLWQYVCNHCGRGWVMTTLALPIGWDRVGDGHWCLTCIQEARAQGLKGVLIETEDGKGRKNPGVS